MTKQQQITKNIKLSQKLAEYLASHPSEIDDFPQNASFVTFSEQDTDLEKANSSLIKGLLEEGKKVIKAIKTNDKKNPWKFTSITG